MLRAIPNSAATLVTLRPSSNFPMIRPRTARVPQDSLRTVTTLPWPPRFPDLSPIEHIWDHLGRRVGHSHEFERTRGKVTANMKRNVSTHHTELVCLMPDRIASCIHARGDSTGN
ncbi:hypothetical protein TNCV_83631 [Trichonephila clavipes]|nr:hypothetical protein TNCV_83631 [Trichonephila clavipes]